MASLSREVAYTKKDFKKLLPYMSSKVVTGLFNGQRKTVKFYKFYEEAAQHYQEDELVGILSSDYVRFSVDSPVRNFIYSVPLKDIPLWINDEEHKAVALWRLEIGK